MFPTPDTIWSLLLSGVTNQDIQSYIDDYGITPNVPSDPKVLNDLIAAKNIAAVKGDTAKVKLFDQILSYGDKILTILSKNGIIKNQNLTDAGYSFIPTSLTTDTATTNNAPDASNRVFNIDFSDPKVLIIVFLVVMILVYFLFFNSKKNGKR